MNNLHSLKQIASVVAVVLLLAIFSMGCQNDNSLTSQNTMTEAEAAAIIANSLGSSSSTYGLTGQIEELAGIANGGTLHKGTGEQQTTLDTVTITRSRTGVYSYNYIFRFLYGIVGGSFNVLYDMKGTYDIPRMSSDDSAHASFQITNLLADTLLVNGTYTRIGSQTSKLADQKKFNSEILGTFTDVKVNKATKTVTSGTITFTVIGRFSDGSIVSLTGSLTYLGNHHAVLVVNGKTYNVNIDTADVTAA
jgi:hypothetical protein